jgi:hypothetical protein
VLHQHFGISQLWILSETIALPADSNFSLFEETFTFKPKYMQYFFQKFLIFAAKQKQDEEKMNHLIDLYKKDHALP